MINACCGSRKRKCLTENGFSDGMMMHWILFSLPKLCNKMKLVIMNKRTNKNIHKYTKNKMRFTNVHICAKLYLKEER